MTKQTTKQRARSVAKPTSAQLNAIERLLAQDRYREAAARIRSLLDHFPKDGSLHRALVAALDGPGEPHAAALAAFAWAECRPNSIPAQTALFERAHRLGHLLLAERAALTLNRLEVETPGFPLAPAQKAALLTLADGTHAEADAMERFDIGQLHFNANDFAAAANWFQGLTPLPARNNRALALFHLGQIDAALEAFIAGWEADTDNLLALGKAAQLRLYRGEVEGAEGLCTPLAAATARRLDDALPQLSTLLLLRQDAAAWAAFERARQCPWFAESTGLSGALIHHFAACVASRLGHRDEATRRWKQAVKLYPGLKPASDNLTDSGRTKTPLSYPAVFAMHEMVPISWLDRLGANDDSTDLMASLSASNAYLDAAYRCGETRLRQLARVILMYRVEQADGEAAALLKTSARLPVGTSDERYRLLQFLREQGWIARDETVALWDQGAIQTLRLFKTEITREAKAIDLPDDLVALLDEAIKRFNQRQPEAAEACLNRILAHAPNHPIVRGNLASVRTLQGRHREAIQLLRDLIADHPDYLFGRCNLAQILIEDGAIEDAQALVEGLMERDEMHIQEAFALYGTLAMLHRAKGDADAAEQLLSQLESMVESDDEQRRFDQLKRAVDRLNSGESFTNLVQSLMNRGPGRR